jgi:excisionase family DNA binding protein
MLTSDQINSVRCERLIDAERAAEILGVHPKTVKRLAAEGLIPAMKIGRVWRFRESALDAYIAAQLQCSRHPSPRGEAFQ